MDANRCPFAENEDYADRECPPVDKLMEIPAIVEQMENCKFECIGGPLSLNNAFLRLKEIANAYKDDRYVSWEPPKCSPKEG